MSGFALKVEQERAGLLRLLEAVAEELQARAGGFAGTLCSKVGWGWRGRVGWTRAVLYRHGNLIIGIWSSSTCVVCRWRPRPLRRSTWGACWRRSGRPPRRCSASRAVGIYVVLGCVCSN